MCKAQSRNIQEVLYGLFERRKTLLKDVEKEKVFSYCLDKKPRRMGGVLNGGGCSFASTMLIFKQAVNRQKTALFLSKAAIKRQ